MSQGRDYPNTKSADTPEAPAYSAGASGVALSDEGTFSRPVAAVVPTRGLADHQPAMREVAAGDAFEKPVTAAVPARPRAETPAPSAFDSVEPEAVEEEYEEEEELPEPPADSVDPWGAAAQADVAVAESTAESMDEADDADADEEGAEEEGAEEEAADEESIDEAIPACAKRGGGVLTIPLICIGVAIIACISLLPLADENHRLAWEREKLRADLAHLQEQVRVNDEFLQRVADDPTLAERLAQRQMKYLREGTKVLHLRGMGKVEMSPFQLVAVPPPPPMAPYQPVGGALATLIRTPRSQLYLSGLALLLIATGLVLGYVPKRAKGDDGD